MERGIPVPTGREENPYCETIHYEAVGDVTNVKYQKLAVIRYQQIVRRKSNDEIFHDETEYWMWDADNRIIMHSLMPPRSVCVLAGGEWTENKGQGKCAEICVSAKLNDPDWGFYKHRSCVKMLKQWNSTIRFQWIRKSWFIPKRSCLKYMAKHLNISTVMNWLGVKK